jgi:hypothetical protein
MRIVRRARTTVAAAALIAAGCGGAPGEHFVRQADSICSRANVQIRGLGAEPPILTDAQAAWIERLTRFDRAAVAKVRALEPPSGRRGQVAQMLSGFERGLGHGEAIARASRAGDDPTLRAEVDAALVSLRQAESAARTLGLTECALLGRVDR